MIQRPEILQGTDGIRGRIAGNEQLQGKSPLELFLTSGFLTPAFFEKYCYAFGTCLLKSGFARKGDRVVIGWDPRDKDSNFNQAAVTGIRKAGLIAIIAGTLPTPAIPLYMLSINAIAAVVLTASHNPSDQNGIKLFFGATALKFLPPDDKLLTDTLYRQELLNLFEVVETGFMESHENKARQFFVEFCTNPKNSWLEQDDFSDSILVIDASNGAVSTVVEDIFSCFNFKEILYTNLKGNINEYCGVADLEGLEQISRSGVTGAGAKFESYQTLQTIFKIGDRIRTSQETKTRIIGLVFDGDGDRCFRLDYNPETDALIVSSGDFLGIHQARFLKQKFPDSNPLFVNTVESDLNTAITAREMGFTPVLTGVGDKWILSRAVVDMMQSVVDPSGSDWQTLQQLLDRESGLSALELSTFWKDYLQKHSPQKQSAPARFAIGIEESGHSITPGFLPGVDKPLPCFFGNGIKSGLNSIKATKEINQDNDWYQSLSKPFLSGIMKTFYTYYVDKSEILPGSVFREQFKTQLSDSFYCYFPSRFKIEFIEYPEEKAMLYCSILEDHKQCGAIFIRNSGTEDKSALYLRGEQKLLAYLEGMGRELHLKMLLELKVESNEFTRFEIDLLRIIQKEEAIEKLFLSNANLPRERILKEIEFKEQLIYKVKGVYHLTEKGETFINAWNAKV
ncbi:hypothetical protein KJ966_28830 [bacterium]|nr:hypothetical protein [bacterium]